MSRRPEGSLRRGWTTGACATAAVKAAFTALATGAFPDPVSIRLPGGETPAFALARTALGDAWAEAGIVKDAGDDPDVTHGALVVARVAFGPAGSGVRFLAGEGVGTVTLPGLPLPPGEPAINPVPRRMIAEALTEAAAALGASRDVAVTLAIPGGEEMARQTTNGRLGILGGLSILGTTGIVIPYSCASWIHSIHRGVDVARATGLAHIAAATGRTSEAALRRLTGLPDRAIIDMGDFAGGLLKYLNRHPVPRLSLGGGFAKISKLADGFLDLHSGSSQVDLPRLRRRIAEMSDEPSLRARAQAAQSAGALLQLAAEADLPLADRIAREARETARATLAGAVAVEVYAFDRQGRVVGHAGF